MSNIDQDKITRLEHCVGMLADRVAALERRLMPGHCKPADKGCGDVVVIHGEATVRVVRP